MEISGHRQAVRSGGEEMIKRLAVEGIVGGTIGGHRHGDVVPDV